MKKNKITEEAFNKILEEIEELKKELVILNKSRKEAFDAGAGDGWDSPEFEEIEREERKIHGFISEKTKFLNEAEIIEKHNDKSKIDIDDIIMTKIKYPDEDEAEEVILKLVANKNKNTNEEFIEVSINSPLGTSIYEKTIGEEVKYYLNNEEVIVNIIKKLDFKNIKRRVKKI